MKIIKERNKCHTSLFLIFSWKLKKAYEETFDILKEEENLTQNEIDVLLFLKNNAPLDTARDIAKYRTMSKSMISKSVDSLYKRGYLSYEIDDRDKRCVHLKIKSSANLIINNLGRIQKNFFNKITENITKEEYKTVERALGKMYENITNQFGN